MKPRQVPTLKLCGLGDVNDAAAKRFPPHCRVADAPVASAAAAAAAAALSAATLRAAVLPAAAAAVLLRAAGRR